MASSKKIIKFPAGAGKKAQLNGPDPLNIACMIDALSTMCSENGWGQQSRYLKEVSRSLKEM